jgi:hypothetical protein
MSSAEASNPLRSTSCTLQTVEETIGADYHISVDCLSLDRDAVCDIYSQQALMLNPRIPFACLANSTCDRSLADGFLVTVQGDQKKAVVSDLRILEIKGKHVEGRCDANILSVFNMSGEWVNVSEKIDFSCKRPAEPVVLAVVLIASLVTTLTVAVLICFKCRPNRELYESDVGDTVATRAPGGGESKGTRASMISDLDERRELFGPLIE